MPNEIIIKVRVDNLSKEGYAAALTDAKVFGDMLENELRVAGHDAGNAAGDQVAGELNRQLRELHLPELDIHASTTEARERIAELEHMVHNLASDDVTIDAHVRIGKALAELEILKKEFKDVEDDGGNNGGSWAKNFLKSAASKIGGAEGVSSIALPLGAALAPLLGASVAGAIVGGVGLGGIAGGFALAAQDESVQFAMLRLQDGLREHLMDGVEPFTKVAVSSIDQVSEHLNRIDFKSVFASLAPQVAPLVNGVTDLIDRLSSAIVKLVANSGPVIEAIGNEIGDLGSVLSRGFGMLSDNSKQEAEALKDLFAIINGGIEIVFMLVNALTEVYDVFHKMEQISLPGLYELLTEKQRSVRGSAVEMAEAIIKANDATDEQTTSVELATAALHQEDDAIHQVAKSLRASTDPLFAFMDAQDSVTEKQNAMNDAIRKHGQNSKEAQKATRDYQKALIEYVSSAANATNGTGHLTAEQRKLLASAGASKARIDQLDNALHKAWVQANKLDGFEIDITVKQRFVQTGKYISNSQIQNPVNLYSGLAHGGVSGAASGATSTGLTWTGEQGPELLDLPPGTSVRTHGDSMRDAQKMAVGAGAASVIVGFDKSGLTGLAAAIVETLRAEVRTGGGNVQQFLGVQGAG